MPTSRRAKTEAPTNGLGCELGLQLNQPLAPGRSVLMDLSHTFLGSAIQDSPLVGHDGVSSVRAAYVSRFRVPALSRHSMQRALLLEDHGRLAALVRQAIEGAGLEPTELAPVVAPHIFDSARP